MPAHSQCIWLECASHRRSATDAPARSRRARRFDMPPDFPAAQNHAGDQRTSRSWSNLFALRLQLPCRTDGSSANGGERNRTVREYRGAGLASWIIHARADRSTDSGREQRWIRNATADESSRSLLPGPRMGQPEAGPACVEATVLGGRARTDPRCLCTLRRPEGGFHGSRAVGWRHSQRDLFNLGVLRGLAERGLLTRLDYLSTASGGGYLGSWLSALTKRKGGIEAVRAGARSAHRTLPGAAQSRILSCGCAASATT